MASGKDYVAKEALRLAGYTDILHLNIADAIRLELDRLLNLYHSQGSGALLEELNKITLQLPKEDLDSATSIIENLTALFKQSSPQLSATTRTNTTRSLLQELARLYRLAHPGFWVRSHLSRIDQLIAEGRFNEKTVLLTTDLREVDELIALKRYGFTIVRVLVDREIQIKRLAKRDGLTADPQSLNHPNETALDELTPDLNSLFDLKIENNGIVTTPALALSALLNDRWKNV